MKPLFIKSFIALAFSFSYLFSNGQTIKEELAIKLQANIEPVFKEADASFSGNQIPEKWKSFSGVIIAQKTIILQYQFLV